MATSPTTISPTLEPPSCGVSMKADVGPEADLAGAPSPSPLEVPSAVAPEPPRRDAAWFTGSPTVSSGALSAPASGPGRWASIWSEDANGLRAAASGLGPPWSGETASDRGPGSPESAFLSARSVASSLDITSAPFRSPISLEGRGGEGCGPVGSRLRPETRSTVALSKRTVDRSEVSHFPSQGSIGSARIPRGESSLQLG